MKKEHMIVKTVWICMYFRACVLTRWKIQWDTSQKVVVYQSTECASGPHNLIIPNAMSSIRNLFI